MPPDAGAAGEVLVETCIMFSLAFPRFSADVC